MCKSFWMTTQKTTTPSQKIAHHLKHKKNIVLYEKTNGRWKSDEFLITVSLSLPTYVKVILINNATITNNNTFTKKSLGIQKNQKKCSYRGGYEKNVRWKNDSFLITVSLRLHTYVKIILTNNIKTTNNRTFTKKSGNHRKKKNARWKMMNFW